jgi:hypothetical protein
MCSWPSINFRIDNPWPINSQNFATLLEFKHLIANHAISHPHEQRNTQPLCGCIMYKMTELQHSFH